MIREKFALGNSVTISRKQLRPESNFNRVADCNQATLLKADFVTDVLENNSQEKIFEIPVPLRFGFLLQTISRQLLCRTIVRVHFCAID